MKLLEAQGEDTRVCVYVQVYVHVCVCACVYARARVCKRAHA